MAKIDLLPYFMRCNQDGVPNANYRKTLKIGSSNDYYGSGNIVEEYCFRHINGDIDYFMPQVEQTGPWNLPDIILNGKNQKFHYFKYFRSAQKIRLLVDALPVYPMHYPNTTWLNRNMDVGESVVDPAQTLTSYNSQTGQVISAISWPQRKVKLQWAGKLNLGSTIGTSVDCVYLDEYWQATGNSPIERSILAKDWGLVGWMLIRSYSPAWKSGTAYKVGDYVYDGTASYGGFTGLTWECRINHTASAANKPSTTTFLTNQWVMMGPARFFTVANQARQNLDWTRVNPPWFDATGPYLSATGGGGSTVIPNRAYPNVWEQFKISKVSSGIYNIQAYNGKYLCAENGGGSTVAANRDKAYTWEQFRFVKASDGYFFIKPYDNGNFSRWYLSADNGGESPISAIRTAGYNWEKFGIKKIDTGIYNIWSQSFASYAGPEFRSMPSIASLP